MTFNVSHIYKKFQQAGFQFANLVKSPGSPSPNTLPHKAIDPAIVAGQVIRDLKDSRRDSQTIIPSCQGRC